MSTLIEELKSRSNVQPLSILETRELDELVSLLENLLNEEKEVDEIQRDSVYRENLLQLISFLISFSQNQQAQKKDVQKKISTSLFEKDFLSKLFLLNDVDVR